MVAKFSEKGWFLTNSGFIFEGFPLQNTGFRQLNGVMVTFVCQLCQTGVPSCLMKCLYECGHVLKQDLTFTNTDLKYSRLPFIEQGNLVQSSKIPKSKLKFPLGGIKFSLKIATWKSSLPF